jgi:hypothetical protein
MPDKKLSKIAESVEDFVEEEDTEEDESEEEVKATSKKKSLSKLGDIAAAAFLKECAK